MTQTVFEERSLDRYPIQKLPIPEKAKLTLDRLGIETVADLRKGWDRVLKSTTGQGVASHGIGVAVFRILQTRLSDEIYCGQCGAPRILYRRKPSTMLCEAHGLECGKVLPLRNRELLKAFPDRVSE